MRKDPMSVIAKLITRTRIEGLIILLVAAGYLWESQNVPDIFQMEGVPGPTAFPMVLGFVFGVMGLWLVISRSKSMHRSLPAADEPREATSKAPAALGQFRTKIAGSWQFLAIWALVLAYLFFMPDVGFPVSTAILLAAFFSVLGERRWWVLAGLSLAATVLIYFGFAEGLNVRLPLGILEPLVR